MQAKTPEGEFQGAISKFKKGDKISLLPVYVLHETLNKAFSRLSRAKAAKKCTKKSAARTKLLFCLLYLLLFLYLLVAVASLDLEVRNDKQPIPAL